MAKLKKRVLENKSKQVAEKKNIDSNILKAKMKKLVKEEQYADAMDVMAEIAEAGTMDTETMYLGAKCYYATEDYERASRWIDNVLSRESEHVYARLLLVRICMAEGRGEDGLRILDMVLAHVHGQVEMEDRLDLEEDLRDYKYANNEALKSFPHVQAFLGIETDDNGGQEKADLDEQVMGMPEDKPDGGFEIAKLVNEIMNKNASMQDKIKLFNAFAAGCYQKQDYVAAEALLVAALKLDTTDKTLLQNMAYVCVATGDVDRAMNFISQVPMVDFACLDAMKG